MNAWTHWPLEGLNEILDISNGQANLVIDGWGIICGCSPLDLT